MASYRVEFAQKAQKDLKKIPKEQVTKIIAAIEKLALDPFHSNSKKLVDWENTFESELVIIELYMS